MKSQDGNKRPKLWVIIIVVLVILGCCCTSLALAVVLFTGSEGMTLDGLFSGPNLEETQNDGTEVIPEGDDLVSEPEQVEPSFDQTEAVPQEIEESEPQEQPGEEKTQLPAQTEDFLLAITPSGIWKVNEESQEILQISYDVLDAPEPYRKGLSPDKKYYAYITGDIEPRLVLLNLQTNRRVFETPLSGSNSGIKPDMDAGDPGHSVLLAMQFFGSIAWSPDSTYLAFVAAMTNSNTDLYLLNVADLSVSRLSDESSNAALINWSPDGRFIEFTTVNNFGTGAGMDMDAIWVCDRNQGSTKLLEQSTSSGEVFISWINNESFYMNSWSQLCSNNNLRAINAVTGSQEVIFESCFSSVAYDPNEKMGIFAVNDMLVGSCECGEVDEYGTYSFGDRLGMSDVGIMFGKFEQINAFGVELLDPGNLFALYTGDGLSHLFDTTGFPISIPNEVAGLKPYPSPNGDYWAWYPYYGDNTSLWITDQQSNPMKLSTSVSGNVIWGDTGNRLYFYESNQIFYADAPDFKTKLFAEIPVSQILVIGN
ncbi:MAG: hypothetical protein SVT56_02710 [Chloroflexota bacterium]|nr:hypothetical protein [Chloroflexota bacterium]